MAIITFPSNLEVSEFTLSQHRNDMESRSIFGAQAVEVTPPLWTALLMPPMVSEIYNPTIVSAWKVLLMQLRGRTNQLALWDMGRPTPLGTLRGSLNLSADHAAGATTLAMIGQTSKTLLKGDMLGLGQSATDGTRQVVMVTADATSDPSTGAISVSIEPPLRNAFVNTSVVTWNMPTILFRQTAPRHKWTYKQTLTIEGMVLDLLEDPRP
jgi:hypothetical protein